MQTSNFAKSKKLDAVSIALSSPGWFKGPLYRSLNPTWDMLAELKANGDEAAYEKSYRAEILSKLDPHQVLKDFEGKVAVCWEAKDKFCHRHIVAAWIKENTGVEVEEI